MSEEIEYGQKITEINNGDGTREIITEGFFEGLASIKEQRREDIKTSHNTILPDVIKCLDMLKTPTPELTIHIIKDKYGTPNIIQKTWIVKKEKIK